MPDPSKLCRHCRRRPAWRPRGLCWGCYYSPGVRKLYPITSKYAPKGEPTEAELEKLIAERMQNLPKWWRRSGDLAQPPSMRGE